MKNVISTSQRQFANLLLVIANLLLVIITTVYVWLTWHSLKALREGSLREREALHLQEIKDRAIQPIVSWIRETVVGRLTGASPALLGVWGGYDGTPPKFSHTIDDPFVARRRLNVPSDLQALDPLASWTGTENGRVSQFLFDHTKEAHFRVELREFDRPLTEIRQLAGTFILVANECAKDVVSPEIPQARSSADQNSMPEWTNPHLLTTSCMEALLPRENRPRTMPLRPGTESYLLTTMGNEPIAKATEAEKLKHWSELGFEKVRRRWEGNNVSEKVATLLKDAESVSQRVEKLLFTHSLGVDCELVSGSESGWLRHLLRGH